MKLTMLGTGNAMVTECYNTCFVLEDGGRFLMVDGGGGNTVLRQLKAAGLDWRSMRQIFVTHKHVDHLLGILWMVRMIAQHMKQGQYDGEASIYGHEEVISLLRSMSEQLLPQKVVKFIGDRLHLIVLEDGQAFDAMGHTAHAFDIRSTKAKQFGFAMEYGKGKKLVCCGDEPYNECEKPYAENADWRLHEAFCLHGQADIFHPYEKNHSTVKDAAELAEQLKVKNLVLYHTEDRNIAKRKELYLAEGKAYYSGNLYVPDDLEVIEVV